MRAPLFFLPLPRLQMACSVCARPPERQHGILVPGRQECPAGWEADYSGFLLSSHHGYYRTEYVCVDGDPEGVGGVHDDNGGRIYSVETRERDDGLPDYAGNREVTCAVCSGRALANATQQEDQAPPPLLPESVDDAIAGETYVRWGRTTCPKASSTLVYAGMAASSYHGYSGSGSDLLCLPREPQYKEGSFSAAADESAWLYKVEYRVHGYGLSSFSHLEFNDVPCAVCQRHEESRIVVVPGRTSCPVVDGAPRFEVEYAGYIFSERHNYQKCVLRDCPRTRPLAWLGCTLPHRSWQRVLCCVMGGCVRALPVLLCCVRFGSRLSPVRLFDAARVRDGRRVVVVWQYTLPCSLIFG